LLALFDRVGRCPTKQWSRRGETNTPFIDVIAPRGSLLSLGMNNARLSKSSDEVLGGHIRFSEYPEIVRSVLTSAKWKSEYSRHLEDIERLVSSQRRDVLDWLVPLELTREICRKLPSAYVLWPDSKNLREYRPGSAGYAEQAGLPKLTALDVHDRYGPAVLEEVQEYGSATIA